MSTTIDPTWGVPVFCLVLAVIGVTWAKLTVRAHNRRYGIDPAEPKAGTSAPPSQAP